MKTLLFLLLQAALTGATRIANLGNCPHNNLTTANINFVDVTPCDTTPGPCEFHINQDVRIEINFQAETEITAARPVGYGILSLASFQLEVPNHFDVPDDACQNMHCPAAPGDTVNYTAVFNLGFYPQARVVAEWQIHDQHDKQVVCFTVPLEILH